MENSRAIISKDESTLIARKYQPLIQMHNTSFTLPKVRREMAANFKMAIERRRRSLQEYTEQLGNLDHSMVALSTLPQTTNFLLPADTHLMHTSKYNRQLINQTQQPVNTNFPKMYLSPKHSGNNIDAPSSSDLFHSPHLPQGNIQLSNATLSTHLTNTSQLPLGISHQQAATMKDDTRKQMKQGFYKPGTRTFA